MTPEAMMKTLGEMGENLQIDGNVANFTFHDVAIMLIFDPFADRMRLISAICEVGDLEEGMLIRAMEANFHSALDARYAVSSEIVWAAFLHPLSDLTEELFRSAIEQVAMARATFGGEYSSGMLVFGDSEDDELLN